MDDFERDQKLREYIDIKIEKLVLTLGISRSSIHFVENYQSEQTKQSLAIDYRAMKLLHECCQ